MFGTVWGLTCVRIHTQGWRAYVKIYPLATIILVVQPLLKYFCYLSLECFISFVTFKSSAWSIISEWEGLHEPIQCHAEACMTVTTTFHAFLFKFHICVLKHPKYAAWLSAIKNFVMWIIISLLFVADDWTMDYL